MDSTHVLFFSGSIGLGHVQRDLAIAREMKRIAGARVSWLAASPADRVLHEAGETVLAESEELANDSAVAEDRSRGGRLSLVGYIGAARGHWLRNIGIVDRLMAQGGFDLLIGDETYELALAHRKNPNRWAYPFVMIYDFVGAEPVSRSPLERLGVYALNVMWSRKAPRGAHGRLNLFIGEEEDVPEARFGLGLPGRRAWANENCRFVGYVLSFDPRDYVDRPALRARLGLGASPLVVCAIGGTSIGKELLELCGRAYPAARERIAGLGMILVCGPRLDPAGVSVPAGVEVRGYVPALQEHLAACDLAVVQGGGSVTLELTALRRPFIYFPIEGHFEQEVTVSGRLRRHGAGIRLRASRTTPADLADAIVANIGTPVSYASIRVNGARTAAEYIAEIADSARNRAPAEH